MAELVIPSVTPVKLLEDLIKNTDHKKQGLESRNEDSSRVKKRQFQTKPAGTTDVRFTLSRIFTCLGFEIMRIPEPPDLTLSLPHIDNYTPAGRLARSKLLRTWVELEAWVADCSKRFGELKLPQLKTHISPHKLWVKIDSAREEYQRAIGAHPDQNPLGLKKSTHSPELLAFIYFVQVCCDPIQMIKYFPSFYTVCKW
ncbi:hypothetical protein EI94DRAFT_1704508 [Lactarius quietus]|nr:hypothetical protein EI94DRAFT_1704508 [Lactarius quietus]